MRKQKIWFLAPIVLATLIVLPTDVFAAATAGGGDYDLGGKSPALLIFYVALALLVSFACSIAEAVLLSITPSYIESIKAEKPKLASRLKQLKVEKVDRSLAAILTLNTIAHTVGAIGAGAEAKAVFGSAWFGVFSAVMTLLVLVLSEIVPKTIGAVYWQKLTGVVAWYVNLLLVILYPVVRSSERLTRAIGSGHEQESLSRDEFAAMARVGNQAGNIGDNESRIIHNLLQLNSLKVVDVMTPTTVIAALPQSQTVNEALQTLGGKPFSRWPIFDTDLNSITGFILRTDALLQRAERGGEFPLSELKRKIVRVPTSISVSTLLDKFLRERQHIAVVIDEHGGTRGLVSLEDLIETLIGAEIMDEGDDVADMRSLARKLWQERAAELGITEPIADDLMAGDSSPQ